MKANAKKATTEISSWIAQLGEKKTMTADGFFKEAFQIRQKGVAIVKDVGKVDASGQVTDPIIKLFMDVVSKYEDEARERIVSLVLSGEQDPFKYYGIVQELLSRETGSAELFPKAEVFRQKIRIKFGEEVKGSCGACSACSACSACAACVASYVGAAGIAGVAAVALVNFF